MSKQVGWLGFLWIAIGCVVLIAQTSTSLRYIYDEADQLVGIMDDRGNAVAYRYDAVGNLLSTERLIARGAVDIFFVVPNRGRAAVPALSRPGTPVTIHGIGFSPVPAQNRVTFNGVAAVVEASTATTIKTRVPAQARTGSISVTSPLGTAASRSSFTVVSGIEPPQPIGTLPPPPTTASYFSDPAPTVRVLPTEVVLRKNLSGLGGYGEDGGGADILYTGQAATWRFTLPASVDPASVQGAFFRISIIADDHYSVDLARYTLGVWTNRVYIYAGRANLPHGMPFGSHFTNWVRQEYGASLMPSTYTISVANTSATGGGDWIAVDWIELHLLLY